MKSSVVRRRREDEEEKCCMYYWWRQNWLGEKVGQFCWDQHCEEGFVQRMLEGCF